MRSSADFRPAASAAPEQGTAIARLLSLMEPSLALLVEASGRDAVTVEDGPPGLALAGRRLGVPPGLIGAAAATLSANDVRIPLGWTMACAGRPDFLSAVPVPGTDLHLVAASGGAVEPDLDRLGTAASLIAQLFSKGAATTAERAASNRMHALVRNLPFPVVFADSKGLEVYANAQAEALLGVQPGASRATRIAAALARLLGAGGDDRLQRALRANPLAPLGFELTHEGKDYKVTSRWIDDEALAGRIWMFSEVTAEKALQRRLAELAAGDPLTGAYNRRSFDGRLAHEVEQAQASGAPLSMLALDLDHFKAINDRHGHQAGDAVLKEACRRAAAAVRETDMIARVGGEEFAVLLPATPRARAEEVAERIRRAVCAAPVVHEGVEIRVSSSIGVAQYRGGGAGDALVKAADAALYEAKRTGRNRFVSAPL